ncbi:g9658 [Coccomyxa elongata]
MYHPQDALAAISAPVFKGRPPAAQPSLIHHDVANFNRDQQLFRDVPHVMTSFRKAMESHGVVRDPLPLPDQIPPYPSSIVGASSLPKDVSSLYRSAGAEASLAALERLTACKVLSSNVRHPHSAFALKGGETEGVARLQYYLHGNSEDAETPLKSGPCIRAPQHVDNADLAVASGAAAISTSSSMRGSERVAEMSSGKVGRSASASPPIDNFKDTRMLVGGMDNSVKLSAYLAAGCLSPRMVYAEIQRARQQVGADSGHSWLIMHLVIRDFFLFTALKEGDKLEQPGGIQGKAKQWRHSDEEFQRWCQGRTGFPFVDACMRELAATGYMSNRGRQNVSSFLCKAMGHSWQLGAAVFESLLVDHDWAVNTVNWAYFAGVGNDPRDRIFRTVSQGMTYDPEAQLIKTWLPELKELPGEFAHKPWELEESAADACGFNLRRDYVTPMLDASTQIAVNYGRND